MMLKLGRNFLMLLLFVAAAVPVGRGDVLPEPYFGSAISNVTVAVGRQATLACTVHNLSTFKVAWLRVDTQTILTIHNHVMTKSPRVSMTYGDRTWYLHIRNVREKDQGWYMCQINTDPMKSQLGYLYVVVPPDILDAGTTSDLRVREGDLAQLQCNAIGQPKPTLTWKRENGQPILMNNGTLVHAVNGATMTFERVTRQHMGSYSCIATNGVPPTISKRVMLTVQFPPVIWIENQLVGAVSGMDITLECIIEAFPRSINYWSRGDREIIPQGNYEPQKPLNEYRVVMNLRIENVKSEHFGVYKCISRNAFGETEGTVKVYEIANPNGEMYKGTKRLKSKSQHEDFLIDKDKMTSDTKDSTSRSAQGKPLFVLLALIKLIFLCLKR